MDNEALDRMTMALMGASPTDEVQMGLLDTQPVIRILPDANVIKIGEQSFIDRGRAAVFPLIEEIVCLLYTSPSPRDGLLSRMPSSA